MLKIVKKSGVILLAYIFVVCSSPLNEAENEDGKGDAALESDYQKFVQLAEEHQIDMEKFRSVILNSGNFSEDLVKSGMDPNKRQFWNLLPWPFSSLFGTPAPIVVPGPAPAPPIIFINYPASTSTTPSSGPTTPPETTTTTTTTTSTSTTTSTTPAPNVTESTTTTTTTTLAPDTTNTTTTTTTTPVPTQPPVETGNPNTTTTTTTLPPTGPRSLIL